MPKFNNIDEMIGWVKAKGDCQKIGDDPKKPRGEKCEIRIDLPNSERPESNGKRIWAVWAWIKFNEYFRRPLLRYFSVTIVKSSYMLLFPEIRSVKVSNYYFGIDGKLNEVPVIVSLENFKGQKILEQQIPLERKSALKHGEGGYDSIILQFNLGIKWQY